MLSRTNLFIIFFVLSTLAIGFAEQGDANEVLSFPYVAQITGDDVYVRSGPGTQHYSCGKLNKAARVKVVSRRSGWSRVPSWWFWSRTAFMPRLSLSRSATSCSLGGTSRCPRR